MLKIANFSIGYCLALLLVIFMSCGGGGGGEEGGVTKVVLWEMMDPEEREILDELLAEWNAAHATIQVSRTNFGREQIRAQFLTAGLGGGGADLLFGAADDVGPFSIAGVIHPLDEILGAEYLSRFSEIGFDRFDGHVWMLPTQVGNHLCLLYNTDLIAEPPESLEELVAMAVEQTIDENGDGTPERYGLVFESREPFWLVPFLVGFGGWVMDDEFNPTLDTPAMAKALAFVASLRSEYGILPRECDYQLSDTMFKEKKAAFTINGHWSWGGYDDSDVPFQVTSIPLNQETGLWPGPMISSRGYYINSSVEGERLIKVIEVLDYLNSEEVQIRFADRLGVIPGLKSAFDHPSIKSNERLRASWEQYQKGRRMPVVPEMRAIWDAMRPGFQNVLNGESTPQEAARAMQIDAVKKIAEMKG